MSASPIEENVTPPPEDERPPMSLEEQVKLLNDKMDFILSAHTHLFMLVRSLAEMKGVKLRQRQVDGGLQFYWQAESGRIVLPGGGH